MKIPVDATANAVNDHHETLRIADEPGNIIVESTLPPAVRITGSNAAPLISPMPTIPCYFMRHISGKSTAPQNGSTFPAQGICSGSAHGNIPYCS